MIPAADEGEARTVRPLSDDTLLVFLSDCHIGGDNGRDIFESPDDLAALFNDLGRHNGPVELVLAGDFFDCLRIGSVPPGQNRASATINRSEYRALFDSLRQFAAGKDRHVVYLPGNHDAEVWWNPDVRATIQKEGLVHEFALSYAAAFASDPGNLIYCEHGNEFDVSNYKGDYRDPLDTPLGDHIVTDIIPRLPVGRAADALQLDQVNNVFPLDTIPEWIAGRLFYALVTEAVRWVLVPLLIAYVAFEVVAYLIGAGGHAITTLFVRIVYDVGFLLAAFALFFFIAWTMVERTRRRAPFRPDEAGLIRERLEKAAAMPLGNEVSSDIAVFISGHTHAPALSTFNRSGNRSGVVVNSGCWLRQLQALPTHMKAPTVFGNRFVQTHVRLRRSGGTLNVELWEHPRPASQHLRVVERLAVARRLPPEPAPGTPPRIRVSATLAPAKVA